MHIGVVTFPGSNCERDAITAATAMVSGEWGSGYSGKVTRLWHKDTTMPKLDLVILPGGFSYGDYLRCGAMSANAPIMQAIKSHAEAGGYVLGICNGFQVLTEARLLPGALMRNKNLNFICRTTTLRVEHNNTIFTRHYAPHQTIQVPVAHHDGQYYADDSTLRALEDNQQILFRYADADGAITEQSNINGSVANIAGIANQRGNVLGMMPHPERVCDALTGGTDGRSLFTSIYAQVAA